MASLRYNRSKGSRFETRVAERLASLTGLPVERRHLMGVNDRGDLSGVVAGGHRLVIECKNVRGLAAVPQHLREAAREAANDNALLGVVVQKRDRVSIETDSGIDQQYAVLTLADLARLINICNGRDPE